MLSFCKTVTLSVPTSSQCTAVTFLLSSTFPSSSTLLSCFFLIHPIPGCQDPLGRCICKFCVKSHIWRLEWPRRLLLPLVHNSQLLSFISIPWFIWDLSTQISLSADTKSLRITPVNGNKVNDHLITYQDSQNSWILPLILSQEWNVLRMSLACVTTGLYISVLSKSQKSTKKFSLKNLIRLLLAVEGQFPFFF